MNATEFFTLAFTLACILGPAVGLFVALGISLARALDERGFTITIGKEPTYPPTDKERRHDRC